MSFAILTEGIYELRILSTKCLGIGGKNQTNSIKSYWRKKTENVNHIPANEHSPHKTTHTKNHETSENCEAIFQIELNTLKPSI